MPALIVLTTAGIDALVDAQTAVTTAIEIAEVGLSDAPFIAAPTLTALPNELKRVNTVSGIAASETIIHMVARDASADIYNAYGFGLFLADGTLFGTYSQADPIVNKVSIAQFLISIDIAFATAIDAAIVFGDADFLNPPATETVAGVAMIATNALADAGVNDATIMSPKKVKRVLDAFAAGINAAWAAFQGVITAAQAAFEAAVNADIAAIEADVTALEGRMVTGDVLASGGGNLTANRVITVAESSGAELQAGTAHKAASAWSFGQLARTLARTSYEVFAGGNLVQKGVVGSFFSQGSSTITFPIAFSDTDYDLQLTALIPGVGDYDNFPQEIAGTRTTSSVGIYLQDASSGGSGDLSVNWRAEGRV